MMQKMGENVNRKTIFAKQRDDLLTQATLYLGEKYPEHEKELFRMISEKNNEELANILVTLPEIKSAETLKELVSTIKQLHGRVYGEELKNEKFKRELCCA